MFIKNKTIFFKVGRNHSFNHFIKTGKRNIHASLNEKVIGERERDREKGNTYYSIEWERWGLDEGMRFRKENCKSRSGMKASEKGNGEFKLSRRD